MTAEELLRQARLWGCGDPEELTAGELYDLLEAHNDRERRFLQGLALVAHRHAALTAMLLGGKPLPEVWEVFPFWAQEEIDRAKLERYEQMMRRLAQPRRGEEERCEPSTHT